MIRKEEILDFLRVKKADFQKDFNITKLGLFGSFARDEQAEDSDIDLLVEFEPNTENLYDKKSRIRQIVSEAFDKQVDLCREKYIKPYFRQQILQSAIYV